MTSDPASLLLTGFPGFLGTALLPRLLADSGGGPSRAICLVQAEHAEPARRRRRELVAEDPRLDGRIELVEGDITRPGLGLRPAPDPKAIREVWHLAAVYDLAMSREAGLRVNRDGTRHVVEYAAALPHLRRLHHVSTCYVSGRHPGRFAETDFDVGQRFNNHYEETKFLAEKEVRAAMTGGVPATIHRPAIVVGDRDTGATRKYDGPYFVIRLVLRQRPVAFLPVVGAPRKVRLNVVPRDWLVEAMARLARLPEGEGRTFHLADPAPATIHEILDAVEAAVDRPVVRVPLPTALARRATRHLPGVRRLTGIPAEALDYFSHPASYATGATQDALDGFAPPSLPEYVGALVDFVRRHPHMGSSAMT